METQRKIVILIAAITFGGSADLHGQEMFTLPEKAYSLDFSPDSKLLAVGTAKAVKILDATGKQSASLATSDPVTSVSFHLNSRHLAFGVSRDQKIHIWDITRADYDSLA